MKVGEVCEEAKVLNINIKTAGKARERHGKWKDAVVNSWSAGQFLVNFRHRKYFL